jgi:uncharacterized protein YbjQ (UPF0145 family)
MASPLSPAARAVLDAANGANSYGPDDCLNESRWIAAATLRAAAERLGYDSVYDIVCDSGEPNYRVDVADLLAIAVELEGSHD